MIRTVQRKHDHVIPNVAVYIPSLYESRPQPTSGYTSLSMQDDYYALPFAENGSST